MSKVNLVTLFLKMFFRFKIYWWNIWKLEHSLKALCNNVKIKAYLYALGIKPSKVSKHTTEFRLAINWGSEFVVFSNNLYVKKNQRTIHLNFRGKLNISMLKDKVIFEFFKLIGFWKKQKRFINTSLINYWSKFRRAVFKPKYCVYS